MVSQKYKILENRGLFLDLFFLTFDFAWAEVRMNMRRNGIAECNLGRLKTHLVVYRLLFDKVVQGE